MKTAYVTEGYIDLYGDIRLDEPAPATFKRVLVTIIPIEEQSPSGEQSTIAQPADSTANSATHVTTNDAPSAAYTDEEQAELWQRIDAIAALEGAPEPDDGLSAKDYKQILYGPSNGQNDVR